MKFNFNSDPDVNAFIKATGITGGTEYMAVKYLVTALKTNNLWNRLYVLYPFVGGTATTHKYNLKDPRDLDAAYRITFGGSVTHDENGVTFDATNGYGNMHFIPSTNLPQVNRETLGLYSRSPHSAATGGVDMGAATTITQRDELTIRSNLNGFGASINSTTAGNSSTTNTGGTGFYMASRQTSTDLRIYKNGSQVGLQTSLNNGTRDGKKMYIGARNVTNIAQGFTGRNFALAVIGFAYTPAEINNFYNIVQQYQTYLGRQV